MLNTVFKKLMATYFVIIVISFLIIGVLFSQLFGNYFFNNHTQLLLEEGEKINDLVIDYLNGKISKERLDLELQSVERFLNTKIWILDKRGVIYGVSAGEKQWIGKQITAKEMLNVLKGQIIVKKGIYEDVGKTPMVTVGVPIFVNGKVENAIIMHAPLYEITKGIKEVHGIIWTAMAISLLISAIILYLVSKRLSYPLAEMGEVSKHLGEGDFSKRVQIHTDDEIGRVTKTFNYMADRLERIEENRRTFIASVAHELRSPLTLIKGFIQAIVDGTVRNQEQDKYLGIILAETKRMDRLITNLLDLERMEANQYPMKMESFDINELIRRTLIKYEEEIEKKKIEMLIDLQGDKIMVLGDSHGIEQVLINLMDNAMKFVDPRGSIEITGQVDQSRVWITLKDNGIGIPEEELSLIWDRFHKVDKARDRNKGGTGLGLYIVKKIIHHHGQDIKVQSQLGHGTVFTFTLARAD